MSYSYPIHQPQTATITDLPFPIGFGSRTASVDPDIEAQVNLLLHPNPQLLRPTA